MNERIKLLAEQCTVSCIDGRGVELNEIDVEKFAELIVRECVAQIQPMWDQVQKIGPPGGYDYDTFDLAYNDCMNAIKQHFGVEE